MLIQVKTPTCAQPVARSASGSRNIAESRRGARVTGETSAMAVNPAAEEMRQRLDTFIQYRRKHLTGDEKGEAARATA